jgi:hypothetical protein
MVRMGELFVLGVGFWWRWEEIKEMKGSIMAALLRPSSRAFQHRVPNPFLRYIPSTFFWHFWSSVVVFGFLLKSPHICFFLLEFFPIFNRRRNRCSVLNLGNYIGFKLHPIWGYLGFKLHLVRQANVHCCQSAMILKLLGGFRSFYGVGRHVHADRDGQKLNAVTHAPASDFKACDGDPIQVRVFKSSLLKCTACLWKSWGECSWSIRFLP